MAKPDDMNDMDELAAGLQDLKNQAHALGMFTEDRTLLECPACGLKEKVTFDGFLFTCRGAGTKAATGLRFPEPDADGVSTCPECGQEVTSG